MQFTRDAQRLLDSLGDDRKAEVGNRAKYLAQLQGCDKVKIADVRAARMWVDDRYYPVSESDT